MNKFKNIIKFVVKNTLSNQNYTEYYRIYNYKGRKYIDINADSEGFNEKSNIENLTLFLLSDEYEIVPLQEHEAVALVLKGIIKV